MQSQKIELLIGLDGLDTRGYPLFTVVKPDHFLG
jgi:hypothetical protein